MATTVKVAGLPSGTVRLIGWVVMLGGVVRAVTVSWAGPLAVDPSAFPMRTE